MCIKLQLKCTDVVDTISMHNAQHIHFGMHNHKDVADLLDEDNVVAESRRRPSNATYILQGGRYGM